MLTVHWTTAKLPAQGQGRSHFTSSKQKPPSTWKNELLFISTMIIYHLNSGRKSYSDSFFQKLKYSKVPKYNVKLRKLHVFQEILRTKKKKKTLIMC